MNCPITRSIVKTNPGPSGFNLSPIGIGHLATFRDCLIINNIDHNSEFSLLEQSKLKPIAFYDETIFPDVEDSGFDLDIHSVFYDTGRDLLIMLNHLGRLRFFDTDLFFTREKPAYLKIKTEALWMGDVEYSVLVSDCLISSSPGCYHVPSSSKPGLFVSSPFSTIDYKQDQGHEIQTLNHAVYFVENGYVTAIAANEKGNLVAVAFGQDIIIIQLAKQKDGTLFIDHISAQFKTNFHTRFLSFWGEKYLLGAGHDIHFEENVYDPSSLKAGGFMTIDVLKNEIMAVHPFDCDLAWGNGASCLSIVNAEQFPSIGAGFRIDKGDGIILGVDRRANLLAWHWKTGQHQALVFNAETDGEPSYGIGHLSWCKEKLVCGFNRDGARLHVYNFDNR